MAEHVEDRSGSSGLRILVVDDDPVGGRIALEALAQLGQRADCVASGREAVERAASTAYDLILMDCEMPEMNGYEAVRRIRAGETEGGRRAHIVAVTGSVTYNDEQSCFDAGMNAYVPKPIRARQLRAILDGLVSAQGE